MNEYIPMFRQALERRNIRYSHTNKIAAFMRRYSDGRIDVQVKYVFVFFPAFIETVVLITKPLSQEQIVAASLPIEEANNELSHGRIDSDNPVNCLRFCGSFDPMARDEWCPEACEQMQEFIVDYTTDIISHILLGIFAGVTGKADMTVS